MEFVQGLNGNLYAVLQNTDGVSIDDIRKAIEDYFDDNSIITPTINVSEIDGGYKISISDADGLKEYELNTGNSTEVFEAINEIANKIPTKLSELQADSGNRTVTDSEKAKWNKSISEDDFLHIATNETESNKSTEGFRVGDFKVENPSIEWVQAIADALDLYKQDGATKEYVNGKISDLVGNAPSTLDTLHEIAEALGKDKNFSATILEKINGKVDKVFGKGLSTNDLTNALLYKINESASKDWVNEQRFLSEANLSSFATKEYVDGKQVEVDAQLSETSVNPVQNKAIKSAIDGKVDKVSGKGLSSNDYNASAKAKVDAIPSNPKYTDTVYDDTELKSELTEVKETLSQLEEQIKQDAQNGLTQEQIKNAIDSYLVNNPISGSFEPAKFSVLKTAQSDKTYTDIEFRYDGNAIEGSMFRVYDQNATTEENGLMSGTDKNKLDGLSNVTDEHINSLIDSKIEEIDSKFAEAKALADDLLGVI